MLALAVKELVFLSRRLSSQPQFMSSPFVLIDDTNSNIQYSASDPWFEVGKTQNDTGSYGRPFQSTLHGVNFTANFSYPFGGSAIFVYGTAITTNSSGTQDPTWECFIDNTSIGWYPAPLTSENNWILCGGGPSQFQDGPHLLTVKVNISNQQTFWFDQIQFAPSASLSLNKLLVRIDSTNLAIKYSSGWQSADGTINVFSNMTYTQTIGATLTYQFTGTSLSWVGTNYANDEGLLGPTNSTALATYTIDDWTPINFLVPLSTTTLYNQILFETPQLSPGQHKLVVTYYGNSTTQNLVLNYFIQRDAPPGRAGPSMSSKNTPTSTSVQSGSSSNSSPRPSTIHKKPSTEATTGGVIGGLVFISLLLALFFFNRRRNNRRSQALSANVLSPDVVVPFSAPSSNPNPTLLPQTYTFNGQSLPSQYISSKFAQRGQPADLTSISSSGGISPLTPLRPQFSSTAFISPLSSPLPLSGSQTNFDGTRTRVPQAATEPLIQQSPSSGGANARFLRYEDSGIRIPSAEDEVVELPPFYTPG